MKDRGVPKAKRTGGHATTELGGAYNARPSPNGHQAVELGHAGNTKPTQNGHQTTGLDHPGNSKPMQDGRPATKLDSTYARNVPTSVNTTAIAYQQSPEAPAHFLPICKSSAHEPQDIMSDAEPKEIRHPAAELDHADNAQPTGNGHHATELDHPGNSKPIQDGPPAAELDSACTRNVPTSVNTTAIAYQKSPEDPAHLLPICKSSAHKRQGIMSDAELDAELASLRSGIEGLGRSYRTLSFILSSYEKEREMAGNKEIPSERREYIRRLLEYA